MGSFGRSSSPERRRAARGLVLAALALGSGAAEAPRVSPPPPEGEAYLFASLPEGWYARIETSKGTILARLLPDQAPQSVAHFAALAEGRMGWIDPLTGERKAQPYYDGLLVHKVAFGKRFEVGDPTGTGRGAPLIYVPPEGAGPLTFDRAWRLGMTRSGLGRISGVLFFVTAVGEPYLTGRHPCFGEVVRGRDVVQAICEVRTNSAGQPLEQIRVEQIRIHSVGDPPPLPEPRPYEPPVRELRPRKPASGQRL